MNILDLGAEDFENALTELRLQPEQEQFLRDEWAKKNTLSGQMTSAFQGATEVPEGYVRSSVLPMSRPEGMTGFEAIRSGQAELAIPGMLTGTVEDVGQAAMTAEKMTRGINVTEEEMQQAASVASNLAMTGAVSSLGKDLDMNVVSSGGVKPTKNYHPNLFSEGEVNLTPNPYSVAEFYSPVVETIRNTEFPSNGYKGSELLKLLQDKTPGVRKAELDAMDLGIDPQKRYNKDEVLGLAEKKSYRVVARVVDNDVYASDQRQIIRDPEVDTTTIKVNAVPASEEVAPFLPLYGYTHYDPETIAHTRMSIRENSEGQEYMLVEEIQSDLLQKGALKPRGPISLDEAYEEVLDLYTKDATSNPRIKTIYESDPEYFNNVFKLGAENSRLARIRDDGGEISPEDMQKFESLSKKVQDERPDSFLLGEKLKVPANDVESVLSKFENAGWEEGYRIQDRLRAVGKSPLTEDSDAVRLTLQAAMAKAEDSGVTSLVIPNLQRIITSGRARFGSEQYQKYMEPSSGFTRTYVTGVAKFIKQLQAKYGDAIKVDTVELPYEKEKLFYQGKETEVPKTAVRIDFSGLKGVNLKVGRFAEGGMVEDTQMRTLMKEGGMADDGMSVEPVTGNAVPPGSLASEVRDDIPTQLSEGEYVVPADVVRFFGIKFFEDLRSQAKQGLAEMDSQGRIGGAKVDASGVPVDDQLTPEEEQMLAEALGTGMALGGVVEAPYSNPYQDEALLYNGMAEGGDVGTFDRTQFQLGGTSAIQSVKYINPTTKEIRYFQFAGTVPLGLIPEGFVPWTAELEQQTKEEPETTPTKEQTSIRTNGSANTVEVKKSEEAGTGYESWAEKNYESVMKDPYQFGINALNDTSGQMLAKGAGALGLVTGATPIALIGTAIKMGNRIQNIAEANAALKVMESQGLANTAQYKDLESAINKASSELPMAQLGIFGTGSNMYNALVKKQSTGLTPAKETASNTSAQSQKPAPAPTRPSKPSGPTGSELLAAAAKASGSAGSSGGPAPKVSVSGSAGPAGGPAPKVSASGAAGGPAPKVSISGSAGSTYDRTATEDRRAVGGLMSKKKYKTPKKGLAGK